MANDLAIADFADQVSPWVSWAGALTITTATDFADAGDRLKAIKALQKEIEASYGPLKQKASEAHKAIVAEEKRQLAPLVTAESVCKRAMLSYQTAEEEKRLAEQRRLQAEADERARREREALARKAAAVKKPETQQRYQELAAAVVAPVVQVAPATAKLDGISTRKRWRFRVVDEFKVPRQFLMIDESKLRKFAEAMKDGASVDGVQFYVETELASSAR